MSKGPAGKPLVWMGSSKEDLSTFPRPVMVRVGFALHLAQIGKRHLDARPLHGFSGGAVLEIVKDHSGDTYRGVYTVRFEGVVYVLHVFQKKSKHGIATPKKEIELVRERLKRAERDHAERRKSNEES